MTYNIFDRLNNSNPNLSPFLVRESSKSKEVIQDDRVNHGLIAERRALSLAIQNQLRAHKEAFMQYSLLNDKEFKTVKDTLVQLCEQKDFNPAKMFAVINLGFSAKETGYEGSHFKSIARFYSTILDMTNHKGIFSADIKDKQLFVPSILKGLNEIEQGVEGHVLFGSFEHTQIAEKHKEAVQQLKIGESYCLPGGWYGEPSGHAMIYRFERKSETTFKIYIYNAQKGSVSFGGGQKIGEKEKPHPYVLLDNISWEELFFTSSFTKKGESTLFKHLVGLNIPENPKKKVNNEAVMASFSYLIHHRVASDKLPQLFISAQRSGNCTAKSTNCLILDLVSQKVDVKTALSRYKRLSLDVRLVSISAYYEFFKKNWLSNPEKRDIGFVQLREACRNFLRVVNTNFNRPQQKLSEEAYRKGCATIYHILQELDEEEQLLASQSTSPAYLLTSIESETSEVAEARQTNLKQIAKDFIILKNPSILRLSSQGNSDLGKEASWLDLTAVIDTLKNKVEEFKKANQKQIAIFQIEGTLRHLSALKTTRCSLTELQAKELLNSLNNLQNEYNTFVFQNGQEASPAFQNTAMEFFALSHGLALTVDSKYGILKNYNLYADFFFDSASTDPLYTIQDPILLEQRNQLQAHFSSKNSNAFIYNLDSMSFDPDGDKCLDVNKGIADCRMLNEYQIKEQQIKTGAPIKNFYANEAKTKALTTNEALFTFFTGLHFPQELNHLRALKLASIYAHEACHRGKPSAGNRVGEFLVCQCTFTDNNKNKQKGNILYISTGRHYWFCYPKGDSKRNESHNYQEASQKEWNAHGQLNDYLKHPQSKRIQEIPYYFGEKGIKSENHLIVESQTDSFFPFYAALSEPEVQTSVLLDAIEKHLDLLAETKTRQMVGHMLNKLIKSRNPILTDYHSPLIKALRKEPALIGKFERLILAGKQNFIDTMPEQTPRLLEMLFLTRQYGRALFIIRSLYPTYVYSKQTLEVTDSLLNYLVEASANLNLSDQIKQELQLAKAGLILSLPLAAGKIEWQADLFYTFSSLKNNLNSHSLIEDPTFWQLCQKKFFESTNWQAIGKDPILCTDLGNAILNQTGETEKLEWEFKENTLYSKNSHQKWVIDLQDLSLANQAGLLTQVQIPLESNSSLSRLFNKRRAEQKVFGNEIHFQDSIWGTIKLTQQNGQIIIQRQVDKAWYTYLPLTANYKQLLQINTALFYNHALWFNSEKPEDVQICDLETGQKLYQMEKGHFVDEQNKVFTTFNWTHSNALKLLNRFDHQEQISIWNQNQPAQTVLEFCRLKNNENEALLFEWNSNIQAWMYLSNPEFSINPAPDKFLGFKVDRFLPLINLDKTKEKWLIPVETVTAKGYEPIAILDLPDALHPINQKRTLQFFEYDFIEGKPVASSIEAKIYLAHLYLAQKNYQEAFYLLSSISMSESLGDFSIKLIKNLILSPEKIKDFSPNTSSICLHAYLLFKKINPFLLELNNDPVVLQGLFQMYEIYLEGPRNIEKGLLLDPENELELIDYLELDLSRLPFLGDSMNDNKLDQNKWIKDLEQRKKILKNNERALQIYISSAALALPFNSTVFKELTLYKCYFPDNNRLEYLSHLKTKSYLSQFEDFSSFYQIFKSYAVNPKKVESGLFDLYLTARFSTNGIEENRLALLILVVIAAQSKEAIPDLPAFNATKMEKLNWYQAIKKLYLKLQVSFPPKEPSLFKNLLQHKITSTHLLKKVNVKKDGPFNALKKQQILRIRPPRPLVLAREYQDHWFEALQSTYLVRNDSEIFHPFSPDRDQTIENLDLDAAEKANYQGAIEKHLHLYQNDCNYAFQNQKSKSFFKENFDDAAFIQELKQEQNLASLHEQELVVLVQQLGNKSPKEFDHFIKHTVDRQAHARPLYKLENILRAACQKEGVAALRRMNPALDEKEAHQLQSACMDMMIEATHRQQVERLLIPLEKWVEGGRAQPELLEEAQDVFNEMRGYNPVKNPAPLLFEYLSGLRIRAKQAHIINFVLETLLNTAKVDPSNKEELVGKAFQLIMAGGKTSVILSMLVELIAESGQGLFCCILSHHSQMASVTGNLKEFQAKRFNKDIYVLDYSIQDLSKIEVLDLILKRFKEADRKRCALVMKTTLPQIIELKFILELLNSSDEVSKENKQRIDKLREINGLLSKKGVGIFDECDINLSILLDVIIPLGQPQQVKPERAALEAKIFECLVSDKAMLEKIGLLENKQANLSRKDLKEKVIPFIADRMFDYKPLRLQSQPELKGAFLRFVCDQIAVEDQQLADDERADLASISSDRQENIYFLRYLKEMIDSQDRYQQEGAQLICLVKKISLKVLSFSFSRSYNRGYGKDPAKNDGRIIPYLASRTPSTTQFGNMYLALAYQAQAALNDQINEEEMLFLANKMIEAARHYAKKEKIDFLETEEAKQFEELTGISLARISDVEKIKEA